MAKIHTDFAERFDRFKAIYLSAREQTPRESRMARTDTDFPERFDRFKAVYLSAREQSSSEARRSAPNYNVFRILRLGHLEVRTHSAFLAHLLDPEASHGQQHLFLDAFFAHLDAKHPAFVPPPGDITAVTWHIQTERNTAHGNLDIVIASVDLGYLCVIENKVYAGEQDQQLTRYLTWMEEQRENFDAQALIFLTPGGHAAWTAADGDYHRLSYREDVAAWLAAVETAVEAPRVRETVAQYIQLVQQL